LKEERVMYEVQKIFRFDNGFGASVIRHEFSYGGNAGLWELAVIKFNAYGEFDLVYNTKITNNVIGRLTWEEVENLLSKIKRLKKRK